MPIYEYECPTCGRFEVIQNVSEKPLTTCQKCAEAGKKSTVKRVVSPAAFHLKGSGWYKTDYGSNGSGKSASTSSSSDSSGESSSSATDSKSSGSKSTDSKSKGKNGGGCGGGCACH